MGLRLQPSLAAVLLVALLPSPAFAEPMPGLWGIGLVFLTIAFLVLAAGITFVYNVVLWWRARDK